MKPKLLVAIIILIALSGLGFLFTASNNYSLPTKKTESVKSTSIIAVVPHHDLVKESRSKLFEKISRQSQPKTIILLSPNHFTSGSSELITSNRNWLLSNGDKILLSDQDLENKITQNNLVEEDNQVFDNEHGIKNLLGEIKQFFPESKLAPIIIKEEINPEKIKNLSDFLLKECPDCGIIASVDFSHYQPAHVAEIHDIKTLRILNNLDAEEIWYAETDSNASLAFLIQWAKAKKLIRFNLFDHTNSGLISGNYDVETTTHILGYYSSGETMQPAESFTFTFAGDAMFGRKIGHTFQQNNFKDLFTNFGNRTFWGTDISWLNLEGPISDKIIKQNPNDKSLSFNFSKQTIEALKYLRISTIGLANNHTENQGRIGLQKTISILNDAGIDYGGNSSEINENSVNRYEKGSIKISSIATNELWGPSNISEIIKKEKAGNRFVIILPHWGNEYQKTHSASQENAARIWVAAGADLIIGNHPHVIQDAQIINNRLVLYSLGNFIFDQYFSKETQQGLIVSGVLTDEKIKIVLMPVESKNLKPELLKGAEKRAIINKICSNISDYCHEDIIELSK